MSPRQSKKARLTLAHHLARFIGEFFCQPDAHLGFLFAGATMGQLLRAMQRKTAGQRLLCRP
jgi:hypothetical protein